jgi:hypothetical protein
MGPGLPDGIFFTQKFQFGSILEGLAMEDIGKCYGHWVYLLVIWYIFSVFGML